MTLTQHQAAFAAGTSFDDLPPAVVDAVTGHVLDTVGLMLAATGTAEGEAARAVAARWGTGGDAGTAFGERMPAPSAAFVNGTLAHALDFDDTHLPSILHPSATRRSRSRSPSASSAARAAATPSPRSPSATSSASGSAWRRTTRSPATTSSSSAGCTRRRSAGRSRAPPRARACSGSPGTRSRTHSGSPPAWAQGCSRRTAAEAL